MTPGAPCPCGWGRPYADCCGRLHAGAEKAASPEALMRSRYSAYVLGLEPYLLVTWHASTRPAALQLADEVDTKWLGLQVKNQQRQDEHHATVDFVARYRVGGRGHRLHEISNFVHEDGAWFYVDGDLRAK